MSFSNLGGGSPCYRTIATLGATMLLTCGPAWVAGARNRDRRFQRLGSGGLRRAFQRSTRGRCQRTPMSLTRLSLEC